MYGKNIWNIIVSIWLVFVWPQLKTQLTVKNIFENMGKCQIVRPPSLGVLNIFSIGYRNPFFDYYQWRIKIAYILSIIVTRYDIIILYLFVFKGHFSVIHTHYLIIIYKIY